MHFPNPRATTGKGLAFVYAVIFLDLMGGSLLIPIIPYIVREYQAGPASVGLLAVLYSAAAFLAAPVLGWFSDRHGRRPVLLISVLGSAVSYFIFGIGGALWVLFLARLLDGITGGNISTAMAYIADSTRPEERTRYFAFTGVAFGLGFVFGPLVAGVLVQVSLAAPAIAAGLLSLASVLFGYFYLPESLPPEKRSTGRAGLAQINPFGVFLSIGRLPNLGLLLSAMFIIYLSFSGMFTYVAAFTLDRFDATPGQNAGLLAVVGLVQMLGQGLLVYRLAARFGEKKLAIVGLAAQALAYPLFVFAPSFAYLYPLAVISALGNAFTRPTLDAMVANSVAPHEQGRASGASSALFSLTSIFGPLLAGLAYQYVAPAAPYLAGGVLLLVAALLILPVRPAQPKIAAAPSPGA